MAETTPSAPNQSNAPFPDDRRLISARSLAQQVLGSEAKQRITFVVGVRGSGAPLLCLELLRAGCSRVVLACPGADQADRASADLRFLSRRNARAGEVPSAPCVLTADDNEPHSQVQPDRRAMRRRLGGLSRLARGEGELVVVNAAALLRRLPPPAVLSNATLFIQRDADLDLRKLSTELSASGYLNVPVVEDPGSFAVRGGLFDVWPGDAHAPVRVELFGDAVLSLKTFDPDSQRSLQEVDSVRLPPVRELILTEKHVTRARQRLRDLCDRHNYPSLKARQLIDDVLLGRQSFGASAYLPAFYDLATLWDYFRGDEVVVMEDPVGFAQRLGSEFDAMPRTGADERPGFDVSDLSMSEQEFEERVGRHHVVVASASVPLGGRANRFVDRIQSAPEVAPTLSQLDHADLLGSVKQARAASGKQAALDPLVERIHEWREHGYSIEAVARSTTQAGRLATLLSHRGVELTALEENDQAPVRDERLEGEPLRSGRIGPVVRVVMGDLERGVVSPADLLVLITEEEIFGHRVHTRSRRTKQRTRAALEDLRALAVGDYVVHVEHGVGRYLGLQNRALPSGGHVELLIVEYTGGKLFLPVYRLNQIEKFKGDKPKLDRLGGQSFAKTKAKARAKAREMADELLRLYAERKAVTKRALPPPDDEYAAFEASFPYEETSDQAAAIVDVLNDLEETTVMDRLVCGDVGFGKTEVALRAAFRVASEGMQVAVLCPTTVLAQQHYLTFRRRLADYPLEVRVLSRFQTKSQIQDSLTRLRQGSVDIAIGTHRLLSKDVQFKNLGLLVIDEEQRFGVTHKERLKRLRTQVDVLTLTATPIPRTLQLAIGGLRDMSLISTPPLDRRAIRTIVSRYDAQIVKDAIERELSRGGQAFYVYNRVEGLYERAQKLQELLPNARIAVGHGQLKEATLERIMLDFVEGAYDVLVATSIIESGLDIPRANTMIVDRADLFGLAQLYQLRGRVGRSQVRAYCYLMVPAPSEMTEEARTRMEALERYADLGSGFQIAALDMEQRGTGDLLGAEQSGVLSTVGLELFCRMLEEATAELRGEQVVHEIDPELNFDVEALLPDSYIEEVGVRLSLYKRLASAHDEHEVLHLATEMEDRFGPAPPEARNLVELMRLKTELRDLRALVCEATSTSVSLRLRDDTPLDAARLMRLVATQKAKYRLTPDGKLTRRAKEGEHPKNGLDLAETMLNELSEARTG